MAIKETLPNYTGAALIGYTIGVPKPTAEPRIICKSSKRPQSTLNEMADVIFSRKEAGDGER